MNYLGINIGPVVKTLSLARKPRELWAASFLFSYLMKCIVEVAQEHGKIVAPAKIEEDTYLKVGLYPDRLYLKPNNPNDNNLGNTILLNAWETFRRNVYSQEYEDSQGQKLIRGNWLYEEYFNLMHTYCEASSEVLAVQTINQQLDLLELCVMASNTTKEFDPQGQIIKLLQRTKKSSLFFLASGEENFPVETLAEIAAAELKDSTSKDDWQRFVDIAKSEDDKTNPYSIFGNNPKSYHRYFCVVQADGDNMGKTFTNPHLKDGSISEISSALVTFGKNAVTKISAFGGMPIYAGGDDLLFLAPVVGKDGSNIFDLLNSLDSDAFCVVKEACVKALPPLKDDVLPSLSFGVSICFYKHPLYESLESARNLLFNIAKNVSGKKAVAWKLQKHSGECFEASFSRKKTKLDDAITKIINATNDGQTVTQAIHKSKHNWKLLMMCLLSGNQSRLDLFFKHILKETTQNKDYFNALKELMTALFDATNDKSNEKQMQAYADTLYSILRTAKFIKGEDTKDE